MKASVTILFVVVLLLCTAALQFCIGMIILITSGWPIFYRQQRVGLHGTRFTIWKFRTMIQDAEKQQAKLQELNEANGPVFKIHNDPRFTPLGRFLAHTGLDELPQLYNVLRGDMALIGPRPLPLAEARQLKSWQTKRHDIKPGIMSPWILEGYHVQTFDAWMKSDLAYIKRKSFLYDIGFSLCACRFILKLFFREIGLN